MRSSIKIITLAFLALLVPIAVLAADATTPTAPAVQSAAWTAEDYLRAALSGAAGGLISGFVALVIGWMNNRNALKINQQKIAADVRSQNKSHKLQIDRLCYEEKRRICIDFLNYVSPQSIFLGKFDIVESSKLHNMICLTCDNGYSHYANELQMLIVNDQKILEYAASHASPRTKEFDILSEKILMYHKFYDVFIRLTQRMLNGELLLPIYNWELNDFEGSVPRDYRKYIS